MSESVEGTICLLSEDHRETLFSKQAWETSVCVLGAWGRQLLKMVNLPIIIFFDFQDSHTFYL